MLSQEEREFFTLWLVLYGTTPVPQREFNVNVSDSPIGPMYYNMSTHSLMEWRRLGWVNISDDRTYTITQKTLDELNEKE